MPGQVLTAASPVLCSHAGQARSVAPAARVTVLGAPVLVQTAAMMITGCVDPPPPASVGPCVSARWISGATRVTALGAPLVLTDARAVVTPTPSGLIVVPVPGRVRAK